MCQNSVIATQIETWTVSAPVSSDYQLNSSYIFLLNPSMLASVFEGEGLKKEEMRDAGIKKGDYPQYMYLAASIKDPVNPANSLTIPLMIHDTRNPNISSRILEYGGRVLENISDDMLSKGDIMAKIKFEAIKSNEARDFWQKTAEISADLGKTATSLLKVGLSGPFVALTNQIMPQVDKGLRSMENMDDPQKMVSEFYVKLLSKDLTSLYDEKVVGAALYKIHWDVVSPLKSKYFVNFQANKVEDFKSKVPKTTAPYILIVQTKSEYQPDHSDVTFSKPYLDKKIKEFKLVQNDLKKETEREFLEVLATAIDLKKQIDLFQSSLETKYTDWISLARLTDQYRNLGLLKATALNHLEAKEPKLRDKYAKLYAIVQTEADLWFQAEILLKFRDIGRFLIRHEGDVSFKDLTASQLYQNISLLEFYRERLQQAEIQGKLPKEIESLPSFQKISALREEMEVLFFNLEFRHSQGISVSELKKYWLEKLSQQFPRCRSCSQCIENAVAEIEKNTMEILKQEFATYSKGIYRTLTCLEAANRFLDAYIEKGKDMQQLPELVIEHLSKDRDELMGLVQHFQLLLSGYSQSLPSDEWHHRLTEFQNKKNKTQLIWDRLKGTILPADLAGCRDGLF
jgi:hypothetical protein